MSATTISVNTSFNSSDSDRAATSAYKVSSSSQIARDLSRPE